jgi:hypothetical protein
VRGRAALLGALGLAGLVAFRLRRRRPAGPDPAEPATEDLGDSMAEELRRKLDATRRAEDETAVAAPRPSGGSAIDERRRRAHDSARAAIDEMRRPPAGPSSSNG